jgi:hypothetical protein
MKEEARALLEREDWQGLARLLRRQSVSNSTVLKFSDGSVMNFCKGASWVVQVATSHASEPGYLEVRLILYQDSRMAYLANGLINCHYTALGSLGTLSHCRLDPGELQHRLRPVAFDLAMELIGMGPVCDVAEWMSKLPDLIVALYPDACPSNQPLFENSGDGVIRT